MPSHRDMLLKTIETLNIKKTKGGYLKNEELKQLIINNISKHTQPVVQPNTPSKSKSKSKKKNKKPKVNFKINIQNGYFPKQKRLIAIGDIHGDLSVAIKSLKLAGVIDINIPNNSNTIDNIHWIGGETVIVQLGDQIDRVRPSKLVNELCPEGDKDLVMDEGSDLKIINLFENLHEEAVKHGGALFSILGNHELMNVDGDFRYVSPQEFKEFGVFFKEPRTNSPYPYGYESRKKAFSPGGILSKKLANSRYSILQIGSWVFVHGGISSQLANDYTINQINILIHKWLMGNKSKLLMEHINKIYYTNDDTYSPFWSRALSDISEWNNSCIQEFEKTITILNSKNKRDGNSAIKGMIVGHSPQFMYNKGLNSACNNRLWRVDVGMSKAFGKDITSHRKVQILIIEDDINFKIIKEK